MSKKENITYLIGVGEIGLISGGCDFSLKDDDKLYKGSYIEMYTSSEKSESYPDSRPEKFTRLLFKNIEGLEALQSQIDRCREILKKQEG